MNIKHAKTFDFLLNYTCWNNFLRFDYGCEDINAIFKVFQKKISVQKCKKSG